jgi:superfamily II DNA or RNA helicase
VVLPDQEPRPLVSVIHLPAGLSEQPWSHGCVIADGRVHRVTEEPPAEVMRHFLETGAVRVGAGEVSVLQSLAARFHSVGDALREHAVVHAVQPVVCLDLRASDWMQVRAFAFAGRGEWRPGVPLLPGEVLFEWTPDQRWTRVDEARADAAADLPDGSAEDDDAAPPAAPPVPAIAPPAPGDDSVPWLHLPDPERVGPVEGWLLMMGLRVAEPEQAGGVAPGERDREVGRWLKLTRRTAETASRAWEARPRGVRYLGNRNAEHLFAGGARRAPSVRVESSGLDWFGVSLEWSAEAAGLTPDDLARLRASREPFVRLKSGWVRREMAEEADALAHALADLGIELGEGTQRVHVATLAQADRRSLATLEALGGGAVDAVRALRERIAAFTGVPEQAPPRGLHAELRPYQQRGFEFLVWTGETGLGAVLADDMGLGKTVQALAWLEHLRAREPGGGPALVVCPASVVHNWVREARRFTPGLRVLALTAGEERASLRAAAHDHDLLVTTYALLRRDLEFWREQPLRAAILDEAQHIKNPATAVAKAALELRARHRLALTGTPMENRLLDLWSITAFTNPGMLGTRASFLARFDGTDVPPHARRLLSAKLRPVLLRRLKSQVAQELPDRIEERLDCEMTAGQRRLYLAELARTREALEAAVTRDPTLKRQKFEVLAALTRLRQVCCHPALAGGRADLGSGKFQALHELLEPLLAEGRKVLVFSQFVECLKLVERELRDREVPYHLLTGATTRREQVVGAFESDARACVFLISLKAGGTGLNLTAASDVVLLDPWWNPAVEAQAIDRTHRIGQTRTVIAYRLIARGTVEDRIAELQERKKALIRDVLAEEAFARTLTAADLRFLLEAEPEGAR